MSSRKLIILLSVMLSACGGGGGADSSVPASAGNQSAQSSNNAPSESVNINEGYFIDSPVKGLLYETTTTQAGSTDNAGKFLFADGEVITFKLGDTILGEYVGEFIITPVDLDPSQSSEGNTAVNMVRLLLALDEDGNPENGIEISEASHNAFKGVQFNLNVETELFESSQLKAALAAISKNEVAPVGFAKNHLSDSLEKFKGVTDGSQINELIAETDLYKGKKLPADITIDSLTKLASVFWFDKDKASLNVGWVRTWFHMQRIDEIRQQLINVNDTLVYTGSAGTQTVSGSLDGSGHGTFSILYDKYNEGVTTIEGGGTITITADETGEGKLIDIEFNELSFQTGSDSFVANGSISVQESIYDTIRSSGWSYNMTLQNTASGEELKLVDLKDNPHMIPIINHSNNYYSGYTGRIYLSSLGFIDVDSVAINNLQVKDIGDYAPRRGYLYFNDYDGNRRSKVTVLNEKVRIDLLNSTDARIEESVIYWNSLDLAPKVSPNEAPQLLIDDVIITNPRVPSASQDLAVDLDYFKDLEQDEFTINVSWKVNQNEVIGISGPVLPSSYFSINDEITVLIDLTDVHGATAHYEQIKEVLDN